MLARNVRSRHLVTVAILAAGVLALGACAPQSTLVGEVAKAAFDQRASEDQIVDIKIKTGIIDRLTKIEKSMAIDLSVDVWKRKVMMTGSLSDAQKRNQAVRAAQLDERIVDFYNDIMIVSEDEQAMRRDWIDKAKSASGAAGKVISDMWIETKIGAQLLAADGVGSADFRWRSVLGNVFVLGQADDATELSTVLSIISATQGVNTVKSHAYVSSE